MKKIIILVLAVVLLMSFCACDHQTKDPNVANGTENQEQQDNQRPNGQHPVKPLTVDDVMAAPETDAGDFWYEVTDAGVEIKKYEGDGGIVVVPAQIEGVDVTLICAAAFANVKTVTAVKLPDTIQAIDDNAFGNCTSMEIFISGAGVKRLGQCAFNACIALKKVILNEGLEEIDLLCFGGVEGAEIEIPATVTTIVAAFLAKSADNPVVIIGEPGSYAEQYVELNGEDCHLVFRARQ